MPANSDNSKNPSGAPTPPPGRVYEVLTAGDQLGDYTVEACLAYDILGSLYHVTTMTGEAKTLFVLPKLLSEDESFLRRFRDFKDKQVLLSHPRILGMGESQTIEGRFCFLAEATSGKSLPDYLGAAGIYPTFRNPQGIIRAQPSEAAKDFTPEKVRKVAREVLEALEFAHSKGVLHLNLTPSNLLLLDTGDIKVLGFGLYGSIGAHSIELLVSSGIPPVSLGPRNVRLNTADIISPEVHLKQEPDARADFYAFGMSIYWLLTGLKPAANYRPPSGIVPGLHPGWDLFLARCLTRERSKRYSNAKVALKDLENLENLANDGYADDVAKIVAANAHKKLSRKKVVFAAVGGAAAAIIAAMSAYFLFMDEGPGEDAVPVNSPVTRHAAEAAEASLVIKTSPARASANIIPPAANFAITGGELRLDAKPGKYVIMINSHDYLPQRSTVVVETGKPLVKSFTLFKEAGFVDVTTAPGAQVSLQDASGSKFELGTSDAKGRVSAQAAPGTYTLVVEKANCQPAKMTDVVVKNGEHTEKKITLEGAPAALLITSTPPGAGVSIDGKEAGTTPIPLENLQAGRELTLVFTRENYRPVTKKIVLDAGEKKTVDSGEMLPCVGSVDFDIRFSGKTPTPAQLSRLRVARSDDKLRPHTWDEAQKLPKKVTVGHYLLTASHPDYEPFQNAYVVKENEETIIDINLKARPAALEITGLPDAKPYALRINNNEYTSPPREVPAEVPLHIEVEVRDYDTFVFNGMAEPRKPFTVAVNLKRMSPALAGKPYDIPYMGTKLVWIPAGETTLGSTDSETGHTVVEEPVTRARFTAGFWMGVTEVTQAEYRRVLDSNPSSFKRDTRPVENVSYNDAVRYCKVLTAREREAGRIPAGYAYRLPNELEWEYACRAGKASPFSFGAKATPAQGNFVGVYPPEGAIPSPSENGTAIVASYPANAYGLYNMHDNVREWTIEPYKPHLPGGRRIDYNPAATDMSAEKVLVRGGSWRSPATRARSAWRPEKGYSTSDIADDIGFRIVLAPEQP